MKKSQTVIYVLIYGVMLTMSVILLVSATRTVLTAVTDPNLDIVTELIRLFWGAFGTVYFVVRLLKIKRNEI